MPNSRKGKSASREVDISKGLSYLLRHGAKNEGLELDEAGWANVADVLAWRRIAALKVDFPTLQSVVATNDKKRYKLEPYPTEVLLARSTTASTVPSSNPRDWRIRATQGHSITTIANEQIFKPILLTDADCPSFVVHGTGPKAWTDIEKCGGLKRMRRQHIHFATKLPGKMPELDLDFQSKSKPPPEEGDGVISGMRSDSSIIIWVDVKKSLEGGVKWWRSENEVVLTEGIGEPKMLGLEWFKWVETRGGKILYGEKVESEEVKEMERRMDSLAIGLGAAKEPQGQGEAEKRLRDRVDGGKAGGEMVSGEKTSQDQVDVGKVSQETPQERMNDERVLQERATNGSEKVEPAAVVKDKWDD